jgi:uncharacterized protein (TIGR00369 family)
MTVDYDSRPLHQFIGARLIDPEHPELGITLVAAEHLSGREGTMHGGVVPLVMDGAAYMALRPHLRDDEDAVSHDLHYSVMRPIAVGSTVLVHGRVVKKGSRVAFLEAEATVDGVLHVTARITKTVVRRVPAPPA